MSSAPSGSSALQHVKLGDALEIRDGIIFDFYSGLPHIVCLYIQCLLCLKLMVTFWELIKETLHVLGKPSHGNAASSSESAVALFKTPALEEAAVETGSCLAPPSSHGLLLGSPKKALQRLHPYRGHVVLSRKTPLQQQFDGE